jgi:hypothetical protein
MEDASILFFFLKDKFFEKSCKNSGYCTENGFSTATVNGSTRKED